MFAGQSLTAVGLTLCTKIGVFSMHDIPAVAYRASSVKHQPRSNRYYFDVGIGSVCLSGADTGGAYCLLEVGLAPGMSVPRHKHTREDEAYFVLVGELEVTVGDAVFILTPGDSLVAPRDIPHQLRNSGDVENHYLLVFAPSGFEEFLRVTAVPAPDNAAAPTKPPAVTVQTVHELAADFGILFEGMAPAKSRQEHENISGD
jgi:quercetin dioxygenase-like cupin family protein